MTRFSTFACSILLSIGIATLAVASTTIDQEQVNIDPGVALAVGGPAEQKLAQVFKAGKDGYLRHVTFPVSCEPYTLLTVSLQKIDAGMPSGSILASESLSGYLYPPIYPAPAIAFRIVEFTEPARVHAGEEYAVVLEGGVGTCSIWGAPAGDSDPSGEAFFDARPNRPGWLPLDLGDPSMMNDLVFQVFVDDKRAACKSKEKR